MGILRKKMRVTPTQQKMIVLSGGLNEALSYLEMKPGDLTECFNYIEREGISHGYSSYPGYERYDGQALASTIAVVQDENGVVTSDVAREAQRTLITAVPGGGRVKGLSLYGGNLYAWRDTAAPATLSYMYKATASGWSTAINGGIFTHGAGVAYVVGEIITGTTTGATGIIMEVTDATHWKVATTSVIAFSAIEATTGSIAGSATISAISYATFNDGGFVRTAVGRFAEFNANQEVMLITDGVSAPNIFYNGILAPLVPTAGTLPTTFPTHCGIWRNRAFLAYPGGHLLFSEIGDPYKWDATADAGEIYVGEDITDIVLAPGGRLIITTQNKIRVITYGNEVTTWLVTMDEFSETTGSIPDTMKRIQGAMYFCDDLGVASLESTDRFGEFLENSIAKKVQKTYQAVREYISVAMVNRSKMQYTVWANRDGEATGLVFTFSDANLRGVGIAKLPTTVECVVEGKTSDRDTVIYFGDDSGYVYKMDSGTSFDGAAIVTRGATSFYHYGSPNIWKHFRRLTFEATASRFTEINFRADFDYSNSKMPASNVQSKEILTGDGIWGEGVWGTFVWGASYLEQLKIRELGYGGNMRVLFYTSSKYRGQHTISNIITEYSMGSIQIT